ncbi:uncharacterized protein LY79DRAFT_354678 [Colletotrichum navitas]|uniref:Uncharacterized protein n=1 Tax=Colletotrichum navitas TaxID=681940 RepID=A0AAD8V991_9PEZI|nr:uncharacterized protein LY79DRAFT_354678 [Colletotrichum navitas]KAK1597724.1 hypothetical protein LY79DRAFT_354678 [Colletotrichum navitas]
MQNRYRPGRAAVPTHHVTRKLSCCHREGESRPRSGLADEPPGGRPHSSFRINAKSFEQPAASRFGSAEGLSRPGCVGGGQENGRGGGGDDGVFKASPTDDLVDLSMSLVLRGLGYGGVECGMVRETWEARTAAAAKAPIFPVAEVPHDTKRRRPDAVSRRAP